MRGCFRIYFWSLASFTQMSPCSDWACQSKYHAKRCDHDCEDDPWTINICQDFHFWQVRSDSQQLTIHTSMILSVLVTHSEDPASDVLISQLSFTVKLVANITSIRSIPMIWTLKIGKTVRRGQVSNRQVANNQTYDLLLQFWRIKVLRVLDILAHLSQPSFDASDWEQALHGHNMLISQAFDKPCSCPVTAIMRRPQDRIILLLTRQNTAFEIVVLYLERMKAK